MLRFCFKRSLVGEEIESNKIKIRDIGLWDEEAAELEEQACIIELNALHQILLLESVKYLV